MNVLECRLALITTVALLMFGLSSAPVGVAAASAQQESDAGARTSTGMESLEDSMETALGEAGVPGGTIAVVTPSGTRTGAVGTDAAGHEIGTDAQMLWGSVSKPLAASAVMRLAREGALDLDDRALDYVPEIAEQDDPALRSITIRELLNHTSGLPFGATHLDVDEARRAPEEVIAQLPQMTLLTEPGQQYAYSSLGYVFVQAVAESASGVGLSHLESRYFPGVGRTEALSPGSRFVGDSAVRWSSGRDGAGVGYGYQGGAIESLGRFAEWTLTGDGASVLDEMVARPVSDGGGGAMGLGWRLRDDGVVWHTGTVPGYFSAVHIDRDRGVGVVVTLNASGLLHENEMFALSQGLFDEARGIDGYDPSDNGSPLPLLVLVVAALLAVLAIALGALVRARRRFAFIWVAASLITTGLGWWLLPSLYDAPARYVWLWMPGVGLGFVILPVVLAGVAVWWCVRPRANVRSRGTEFRGVRSRMCTPARRWFRSRSLDLDAVHG